MYTCGIHCPSRIAEADEEPLRGLQCLCWRLAAASLGKSQTWGSSSSGRYKTDFNGVSLEQTQTPLAEEVRHTAELADKVFGAAVISPEFTYHSLLCLGAAGQTEMYRFWQSIFGHGLHKRLFYFGTHDRVAFKQQRPELPVGNFAGLKTFFVNLPGRAHATLCDCLQEEGVELPAWLQAARVQLCVRVPAAFAQKVSAGSWCHFALPEPALERLFHGGERQRARLMGWSSCPFSAGDFLQPPFPEPEEDLHLTAETASFIANTIRQCAKHLNSADPQQGDLLQDCHTASTLVQRFQDELDPANLHEGVLAIRGRVAASAARLAYESLYLVRCMLLVHHLRDASSLRQVLKRSVEVVIPGSLAQAVLEPLNAQGQRKVPSAAKISRARLTVDAALMLCIRELHKASDNRFMRYMMADSSVQGHHDFLLIRCTALDLTQAANMFCAAKQMFSVWDLMRSEGLLDRDHILEAVYQDVEHYNAILSGLKDHLLPSIVIGSGHATLFHKFHGLMHAFFLETGSAVLLQQFCETVFSFITDQGVEFGFTKVPPVSLEALFPWMPVPAQVVDEHEWAPGPDEAALRRAASVDLSGAVGIPGMLHIVHNSSKDLSAGMTHFDATVLQLQHVSKLLRRRDSRERLLERCFSDPTGRVLQPTLRKFNAKLHTGRWGSLAECVKQMLEVETVLRWGWDLEKYGRHRPDAGSEGVDIAACSDAISSPFFWSYVHMLKGLADMVSAALTWCESCPCHGGLRIEEMPRNTRQKILSCPLRGCRAPELANGDFMKVLRRLSDSSLAHFLTTVPRDIEQLERAVLVQEFQKGRAHMLFVLAMRLQHWRVAPYSVFGCGHLDEDTSKGFLRRSLQLQSPHKVVRELQTGAVASEAQRYLDGSDLDSLTAVTSFLGKLLFTPIAERRVEGDHAQARFVFSTSCNSL